MTLYELRHDYENALNNAEIDENGEILNAEALESIMDDLTAKIEQIVLFIKNKDAEADAIDAEIKNLQARKKQKENEANSWKRYVDENITKAGLNKVETARCKVSYRVSKPLNIEDESLIPHDYMRVSYEPDKMMIKEAINAGVVIPGCSIIEKRNMQIK